MSALEFGKPRRRFVPGGGIVLLVVAVLLVAGGFWMLPRFEWHKPQIKITPDTDTIGLAPVEIAISEKGTGLKSATVTLSVAGTERQAGRHRSK